MSWFLLSPMPRCLFEALNAVELGVELVGGLDPWPVRHAPLLLLSCTLFPWAHAPMLMPQEFQLDPEFKKQVCRHNDATGVGGVTCGNHVANTDKDSAALM